jgi:hypothetical protein
MRPLTYEDLRAVESVLDEMYDAAGFWDSGAWLHIPGGPDDKLHVSLSANSAKMFALAEKMRLYIAPDSSSESYTDGTVDVHECGWCGAPTKYPTDRDGRGVCIACSVTAK